MKVFFEDTIELDGKEVEIEITAYVSAGSAGGRWDPPEPAMVEDFTVINAITGKEIDENLISKDLFKGWEDDAMEQAAWLDEEKNMSRDDY